MAGTHRDPSIETISGLIDEFRCATTAVISDNLARLPGAVALGQSDFPVFARTAIHRGPYKNGPGEINVPVNVGGMIVSPGDIVVGDEDGVVAFSIQKATALLAAVRAQEKMEADILISIREGRYTGAYAKPSVFRE